jgi:mono/diheme cytochrome c family protein
MITMTRLACAALLLGVLCSPSIAQDKPPIDRGRDVYDKWCAPCHYRITQPSTLPERTDLTPERIVNAVRNGVFVMPRFRKTEISEADLRALSAYLTRNSAAERIRN